MSSTSPRGTEPTKKSKKDQYYTTEQYDDAVDEIPIKRQESIKTLYTIMTTPAKAPSEQQLVGRMKEEACYHLVRLYLEDGKNDEINKVMIDIRPFFDEISKPRAAKIIRTIIELVVEKEGVDIEFIISLVQEAVKWATEDKRSFLRQRLQAKLAELLMIKEAYRDALILIKKLMREIKKIEDKPLIVDLQLIEAMVYFKLRNYPKSRGALTYARATATGFYCPPLVTANIEQQAGMLSCREKDYPTAESYFYEATDNFLIAGKVEQAVKSFKYSLFCKILNNQSGEVTATIQQRSQETTAGASTNIKTSNLAQQQFLINTHIKAMEALAVVYQTRQYKALDELLAKFPEELAQDTLIVDQLELLKSNLLEHSIKRIIEAYTRIDLDYIAKQLALDRAMIEAKISNLILDEKLSAQLDHQYGDVIIIQHLERDELLDKANETLAEMGLVVDKLGKRLHKISNPAPLVLDETETAVAGEEKPKAAESTEMKD